MFTTSQSDGDREAAESAPKRQRRGPVLAVVLPRVGATEPAKGKMLDTACGVMKREQCVWIGRVGEIGRAHV